MSRPYDETVDMVEHYLQQDNLFRSVIEAEGLSMYEEAKAFVEHDVVRRDTYYRFSLKPNHGDIFYISAKLDEALAMGGSSIAVAGILTKMLKHLTDNFYIVKRSDVE